MTPRTLALLAVLLPLGLSACSMMPRSEGGTLPTREEEEAKRIGRITGDDGITLFGGKKRSEESGNAGIGVNSFLWRAALDSISFMPLTSADPFGGVIITDWYSGPDATNERYKLTVYILDRQLRADGVRVAVFRQTRDLSGAWADAAVDSRTGTDLENAILTRARQMRLDAAKN